MPRFPGFAALYPGYASRALYPATPRERSTRATPLPDSGERYFSTPLFADVNEGSDDDWLASLLP